ncbi:MAG: hypothetical protein L5655_02070 [Thermosediminibacteraceae bacterium]|nr:hypothetical protein [Thermosediminibacteraceae bacterium]
MKPIKKLIMVCSFFSFLLVSGCKYFADPFLSDVSLVIDKINSGASEIDYKEYVKIEVNEPKLVFDHTTVKGGPDNEACNVIYDSRITNISGKPIKINLKMFAPPELHQISWLTN